MAGFRGGMGELMRQASRLQRKVEARKEELKAETVEAAAGNDQVKVVVNGGGELVSVGIDPALLKAEDLSMVQDLIVAAANAALQKSQKMVEAEIEKVTGGIKIPGIV
jgi:DNA-binding YbaB/EbfC family protein